MARYTSGQGGPGRPAGLLTLMVVRTAHRLLYTLQHPKTNIKNPYRLIIKGFKNERRRRAQNRNGLRFCNSEKDSMYKRALWRVCVLERIAVRKDAPAARLSRGFWKSVSRQNLDSCFVHCSTRIFIQDRCTVRMAPSGSYTDMAQRHCFFIATRRVEYR